MNSLMNMFARDSGASEVHTKDLTADVSLRRSKK
jgi:hypothetical protein